MDCRANSDLFCLHDEKFDFDVSLSPASSNGEEDEDEVFAGPAGHKENCVSVNVKSRIEGSALWTSWSPLTGDQLDAVCQEAHKIANQLQCSEMSQPQNREDKTSNTIGSTATDGEEFVQDTEAKLGVFGQTASVLSPIKRQTFCVQDSPMKQLPPAIQHRMLRGSSARAASSTLPTGTVSSTRRVSTNAPSSTRRVSTNAPSFTRPGTSSRLSTSSPVARTKPQPRTGLRGKAPLGVSVVLPSKPAAPTTSCSASKSRVEKTRLQPPSKPVGGLKRSPASRRSSRAESSEDLLSDSASVASDISDSSINSSLLGKRTLAPPTKGVVKRLPVVKAPPLQSRRVIDRRNTSSSSSSVSSFNSSISLSPAKGKMNSSLTQGLSSSNGPTSSSISRVVHSTADAVAEPLSTQARKTTPLKRAEVTPTKRVLEKTGPVPTIASARPQSALKTKSKPEALVPPTPSGEVRGPQHGEDTSKMLKPKRLMSMSSTDSLPQKPSAGPLTPSAGSCRSQQVKVRRPSALPTPVRCRMSTIPVATPTGRARSATRAPTSDTGPAPGSALAVRDRSCSPIATDSQVVEPNVPSIKPFSLEEEEQPTAPPSSSPPQPDLSESTKPEEPSQDESEPCRPLIELETTEESNNKTQEVLLLDLPAPVLQPQEKLLIDLTNTPDLIRTGNKSCIATQLIDLSSPLIKWSPEDKRENDALLINLSF